MCWVANVLKVSSLELYYSSQFSSLYCMLQTFVLATHIIYINNLFIIAEKDTCDDPDFVCSSVEVCLEGPHGAYCQCQTGYIRPTPEGICTGEIFKIAALKNFKNKYFYV